MVHAGVRLTNVAEELRQRQGDPRRLDGDPQGRLRRVRRPLRLRQVHAAADDRGPRGNHRRADRDRGPRRHPRRAADRGVAMVFQNYALYPHLTRVREHGVLAPAGAGRQGRDRGEGRRRRRASCSSRTTCKEAVRASSRAASGSGSPSAAPSCAQPKVFLFDEPLSQPRRGTAGADAAGTGAPAPPDRRDDDLRHPRPGRGDDPGRRHLRPEGRPSCSSPARRCGSTTTRTTASSAASSARPR